MPPRPVSELNAPLLLNRVWYAFLCGNNGH
jgi:hypothetical protein